MDLNAILRPECTVFAIPGSKKKALELIGDIASAEYSNLSSQEIFENLIAREKMGSTGIGNGIAIPHGSLKDLTAPVAILMKCQEPIPFEAIDNQNVDIIFALLVPAEQSSEEHLAILSAMAKKLSDKQVVKQLRKAKDETELYQVIIS